MKKLVLVSLMVLVAIGTVFADDKTASTVIEAVVAQQLSISSDFAPTTPIDVFNTSSSIIGYINVFSNKTGAWKITVTSTNLGHMTAVTSGNTDIYPYTFRFGTTKNINLSSPYVQNMSGKTGKSGTTFELGVDYSNFWDLPTPVSPDTYQDTITITIAAA